MINNVIATKHKKANIIKKQINTDGKRILKSKEVLKPIGNKCREQQLHNSE